MKILPNTHLEHLEDFILNHGYDGANASIEYLYGLHKMLEGNATVDMTIKWDGAPAIVAGIDPQTKKFFVGTKSVFNKDPKLNFTKEDIDRNHPAAGLNTKLRTAYDMLRGLKWDGRVLQGDMMFMRSDIKTMVHENENYLYFKPNTIAYAAKYDSDLGRTIAESKMGIVWHTEYKGSSIYNLKASFNVDATTLGGRPGLWMEDANIKDFTGLILTENETDRVLDVIRRADESLRNIDPEVFTWLNKGTDVIGKEFLQRLKAHVNEHVREGSFGTPLSFARSFTKAYIRFMETKINGYKTQAKKDQMQEQMVAGAKFITDHRPAIMSVYDLYLNIMEAKLSVVRELNSLHPMKTFVEEAGNFRPTNGEGFVSINQEGNALKLVDRLEFSKLNFEAGKPGGS